MLYYNHSYSLSCYKLILLTTFPCIHVNNQFQLIVQNHLYSLMNHEHPLLVEARKLQKRALMVSK